MFLPDWPYILQLC